MPTDREVAYELLRIVQVEDAYANLELPKLLTKFKMSGRDAGFVTELAFGCLRWRGFIDAVIEIAADRKLDRVDAPLRDVLRLGAYQLLFMRVPAHAAVNSGVELTAKVGLTSAKGFVNATLRRVSERSTQDWQNLLSASAGDELAQLSVKYSHPRWQVSALRDALGADKSELEQLLAANNSAPAVTVVSRIGPEPIQALISSGAKPGGWSELAVKVKDEPSRLPGVSTYQLAVQDEGSQIVGLTFANAEITGSDAHWLDLCAGPGGKTALLASVSVEREAAITAVEPQPNRAQLVRNATELFKPRVQVIEADGRDVRFATSGFDRVLVDAPCTGLGVIRRRPESRWRKQPSDVSRLSQLQRELLANAAKAVRPGGIIGYVTCSPHLAETEFVVEDFLKANSNFELLDARESALTVPQLKNKPAFSDLTQPGPFLRLWPHRHDTDGMFLALLRRK